MINLTTSKFIYFKEEYKGDAIHLLKNGTPFDMYSLFNTTKLINDDLRLVFSPTIGNNSFGFSNSNYFANNICITINNALPSPVATIYANPYPPTPGPSPVVNCRSTIILVKAVKTSDADSANSDIICYLNVFFHNAITEVWLGPETISFCEGLDNIKYSVLARFEDGAIAEISHAYYGENFIWSFEPSGTEYNILSTSTNGKLTIDSTSGIIKLLRRSGISDSTPIFPSKEVFPIKFGGANIVKATFKTGSRFASALTALGKIIITDDYLSTLELVSGKPKDPGRDKKFLILGDGFKSTERNKFIKYATELAMHMKAASSSTPWDLVGESFDYFAFHLPSEDDCCSLLGEYALLWEDSDDYTAINVNLYIQDIDSLMKVLSERNIKNVHAEDKLFPDGTIDKTKEEIVFDQFKKDIQTTFGQKPYLSQNGVLKIDVIERGVFVPTVPLPPQECIFVEIISLSKLISIVGLPSWSDSTAILADKVKEWRILAGVLDEAGTTIIGPSKAKFRVKIDTDVDYLGLPEINQFVFLAWRNLSKIFCFTPMNTAFGVSNHILQKGLGDDISSRFDNPTNKIELNKFLRNTTCSNPKLGLTNFPIGTDFFKEDGKGSKNQNNFIIISKYFTSNLGAVTHKYSVLGNIGFNRFSPINYTSMELIRGKIYKEGSSGKRYKPSYGSLPKQLGFKELSTAIHEICHNYLDDEYGNDEKYENINPTSDNLKLNLDSKFLQVSSTFDYNKARWLWPRIKAIAICEELTHFIPAGSSTPTPFLFRFKTKQYNPKVNIFKKGDKVLLRPKELFGTISYIEFTIDEISSTSYPTIEIILERFDYFEPNGYEGYLLILPIPEVGGGYQKLIHKTVLNEGKILSLDGIGNKTQMPNEDVVKKLAKPPLHIVNLVGLYQGGHEHYNEAIYHPTGYCIMRNTEPLLGVETFSVDKIKDIEEIRKKYNSKNTSSYLCHVCRYIIVDAIDPLQHPEIDKLFEYPNP